MNRIRTIVDKEWAEVFKNRFVLFTVILLPVIMTALPLGILYFTRNAIGQGMDSVDVPGGFFAACGGLSPGECLQMFILSEFLVMFMMIPAVVPITIAAYSIVGEKTTRSLEPLLATPVTTEELMAGKSLAAVIPAILATWAGYAIFLLASPLVGITPVVREIIAGPIWLLAVFLVGPLLAVVAVVGALIVSSRVSDPRAAEQISMVVILPLLLLIFGQIAGIVVVSAGLMLGFAAALAALCVALVLLGARLFQRETILTKWK